MTLDTWTIANVTLENAFSLLKFNENLVVNNLSIYNLEFSDSKSYEEIQAFEFRGQVTDTLILDGITIKNSILSDMQGNSSGNAVLFDLHAECKHLIIKNLWIESSTADLITFFDLRNYNYETITLDTWTLTNVEFTDDFKLVSFPETSQT